MSFDDQPLVSIIMPCFNAEKFLQQSIPSVLEQSYSHWELLIIDDGSTDKSLELIKNFAEQDPRIRIIPLENHEGVAKARNHGFAQAKGDYIAFLDADDAWQANKLDIQINRMLAHKLAFTYTAYQLIEADGRILKKTIHTAGSLSYADLLKNTIICCSTVVLDRQKTSPLTCLDWPNADDTSLWLSILKRGFRAFPIEETHSFYRINADYASVKNLDKARQIWKLYRHYEALPFFKAAYYYLCYIFHALQKRL